MRRRKRLAPEQVALQRAMRRMSAALHKVRDAWSAGALGWDDAKWLLIGVADLVREDLGVEVRMAMTGPHDRGRTRVYRAQVQVGDGAMCLSDLAELPASLEARGKTTERAMAYYNCEPQVHA